jgi:phosphoribosyl 1,2-cyclic phosphodiesterase
VATFVRFWGTRGSIPTPGHKTRKYGGNTSCVELNFDDSLFICDGGTGLRELGVELVSRRKAEKIDAHMFFSHTHWDHIQGFPFFIPAYAKDNALYVYDTTPEDDRIHRLLMGQMRAEYFPVSFKDLGSRIVSSDLAGGEKAIDGVVVRYHEQTHPGRSFAYSFVKDGSKIVYATDSELDATLLNPEEAQRDPSALRRLPEELVRFFADADLLIADGQYTDEEYPQKVGWGHARANTVVDLALQAGVKQCAIFHHDPMHTDEHVDRITDEGRKRAAAAGSKLVVFGAREGLEIKL